MLLQRKKAAAYLELRSGFVTVKQCYMIRHPLRVLTIYGKLLYGRKVSYMVSFSPWAFC